MNILKNTLSTALVAIILIQPAFAHTGHDHGHWSSSFLHIGLIAGVVAGLLLVRHLVNKSRQSGKNHS